MSRSLVRCLVAGLLLAGVGGVLPGIQPRRVFAAPISFTALNQAYTQDFNGLAASGNTNAWVDDSSPLDGWYLSKNNGTTYRAGDGSTNNGDLYSFGTGTATERALGSVGSGATGSLFYGVRFINNTGAVIPDLRVSYTGEQWRNGGNTTAQSLVFSYQIGANLTSVTAGTWTSVGALNFTSPIATATQGPLDGNAAANRTNRAANILGINIPAGQQIMLRWVDTDDTGSDHGLAVDDLEVVPFQLIPTAVSWAGSSLQADRALAWAGDTLTYRLSVSGAEGGAFRVSAAFDPHLTILSAPGMLIDGRTVSAQGVLAPGARQTYAITVLVAAEYAGDLSNSAVIFGAGGEHSLEAPPVSVRQALGRLFLPRIGR